MDELKALCEECLAWYEGEDYSHDGSSDWDNAIFEKAMEVCCGAEVWNRIETARLRREAEQEVQQSQARLEYLRREIAELETKVKAEETK